MWHDNVYSYGKQKINKYIVLLTSLMVGVWLCGIIHLYDDIYVKYKAYFI